MIPQPENYPTADAWLAALNDYGLTIGAARPGIFSGLLGVPPGPGRDFWQAVTDFGLLVPAIPGASIETQLRAAYATQGV